MIGWWTYYFVPNNYIIISLINVTLKKIGWSENIVVDGLIWENLVESKIIPVCHATQLCLNFLSTHLNHSYMFSKKSFNILEVKWCYFFFVQAKLARICWQSVLVFFGKLKQEVDGSEWCSVVMFADITVGMPFVYINPGDRHGNHANFSFATEHLGASE